MEFKWKIDGNVKEELLLVK